MGWFVGVAALLLLVALAFGGACALQERMMFHPERLAPDERLVFGAPHEERFVDAPSGNRLHAVVVRAQGEKRGAIVYFHGNAGSLRSWGEVGVELAAYGYDAWVVDYATYGKSTGRLSEARLLVDALATYDAAAQETPEDRLVVFGRSLGTGPAVHVAARRRPRALVLETPYASVADMAERIVPFAPSFLLAYTLRSDVWMKDVKCPVHVLHGDADEVIALASARQLEPLLPPRSTFTVVRGGHHNDLSLFPAYRRALEAALR